MQRGGALKRICAEMTLVRLSDDRLTETPEALLSRIAALEEKIASGCFVHAEATVSPSVTREAEVSEILRPKEEKQEPTSRPAERKALPSWAEIVESVERTDNGAAAMLRLGRGYLTDNQVTVTVNDHFSKMLLDSDAVKTAIAVAINLSGDAEGILPQQITILVEKSDQTDENDPLLSLND